MMMSNFVYPEPALQNEHNVVLTTKQVNQWKNNGFVLVDDVIPADIIKSAISDASNILKTFRCDDFGTNGFLEFPTPSPNINQMTLHPRLLTAGNIVYINSKIKTKRNVYTVGQLLNNYKFRMIQADLWKKVGVPKRKKYGELQNIDQRIHMDWPNHTLVHPPIWSNPQAVEIILYLSDCTECGGSTALVARQNENDPAYQWPYMNLPGVGSLKWKNDRQSAEEYIAKTDEKMYAFRQNLYKREKYAYFKPGTILFYRYDLWHRGTPLKEGKVRYVQNQAFVTNDVDWAGNWNRSPTYSMYEKNGNFQLTEKLIAKLTPFQRSVIGFPRPGSSYWNKYTLEAVKKRYECFGFDITPYAEAIHANAQQIVSKL